MSTQLYGYVIPSKTMFDVADKIREMFLQAPHVHSTMEFLGAKAYKTQTFMQVFDIGNGRLFFRLVEGVDELSYPRFEPEDIGGRLLHYDDRAESIPKRGRAFCEKIDDLINRKRYVLISVFDYHTWRYFSAKTQNPGTEKSEG